MTRPRRTVSTRRHRECAGAHRHAQSRESFACGHGSRLAGSIHGVDELYGGDDVMSRGNTSIVAPGGELIAGPLIGEAGVESAVLDLSRVVAGRRLFDPTGHYARPDVLSLRQPATGEPRAT